ncbi:MAG: hypothetical protein AMJ61_08630 [Desulfobacterales bacterium SG8_35_2]|nr:MAG: hypothetical protein AMJ61_08630 [Desulfobacterales bacterium SG8_35_2]
MFFMRRIEFHNLDSIVHLGKATIRMGSPDMEWDDLHESSLSSSEISPIPIELEEINEIAILSVQNISR